MIKALTVYNQICHNIHLFSHSAMSKYSILQIHLKQMLTFREKLTFVLLLELPEAVPFILQYCSASLAMSEINFWEAREIRRILKKPKGKSLLWFAQSVHSKVVSIMKKTNSCLIKEFVFFSKISKKVSKKSIQQPSQKWP